MRNSTKRILVILGGLAMLIGSFYIYLSMVVPVYGIVQTLRSEVISKRDILAKQQDAERAIKELQAKAQAEPELVLQFISSALPNKIDIPAILNQFQGMARNNGLALQSLSFQYLPVKQSRDPLILPVGVVRADMSFSGTYASLKTFISTLETNIRIIDVNTLKIDGGAKAGKEILTLFLVADIYYQEQ